jgi:DNA-binding transcriptional LysR family regulator
MLEVGRLRALLAMSEHGSPSGAARALGRPVAVELSDWERELGLPLVDGDQLTPAGRRLAEHAGTLLGQLESAESEAAAVAGRVAGTLRLGVGADAGRVLLADTLGALGSTDVRLHVRQLADERVEALDSTLDAVVVGEYAAAVPHRSDAAVERRELFTEPLLLAVPSRHRTTGASVRLAELSGEGWIAGAGDTLVALERAAAGAGFAPRIVAEVGEDALALTLVAAGLGVTLVPASAAPSPADGVRFLTVLDGGLRRTVVAAVRRTRAADPAVRQLLDALAGAARRVAAAVPGVTAAIAPTPPAPPGSPGPARRPDPLFDPLPPEQAPRSNGRRDPWADRVRAEGPDVPGRNGANGTDFPPRNGTPSLGSFSPDLPTPPAPADPLSGRGPADLPGGPDPAGRNGSTDLPTRNGIPGPADRPRSHGPTDLPGRNGPADLPGRPGPADLPGSRGPADQPGRTGAAEPDDLAGMAGLSGFSGRPARGPAGPGNDERRAPGPPGRTAGASGFGDAGALPPPGGLPAPGVDLPQRGGASPYRTPPPTSDAPDFTPELPSHSGPNPYRQDPSAHPAPDPFRSTGPDAGPNPYRATLGGSQLFTASQRPGVALPAPGGDAPGHTRGGDDASLPPAPAGAADDVRLSIFEDLQSEWFVQREGAAKAESWQMAADDGWAAAARLAEPTTAGTTTAGLPRRRPQAMVVPGAVGTAGPEAQPTHRSPQEVRGRLSSYRDGVRRGRHAERATEEE